ncbi:eukaryotic translation initiation factor 4E-binding protein [Polistes fuscatus]|uniref:eukaryotic translation initiation factor 4E-binding protein n=1 Tax=Polistes fuscatus TaxID=30207 RepID=UPI001CA7E53F|nr:eukaryotic translation initiation factor 4E-binding protein [Polistes fuscatus]
MSASPIARQATQSQNIPSKRIVIDDPKQLPANYSSTPGGTLYSTTPGGTRIVYERAFLMNLRDSPISRTPPNIPSIPVDLLKVTPTISTPTKISPGKDALTIEESPEQFEMDM